MTTFKGENFKLHWAKNRDIFWCFLVNVILSINAEKRFYY